MQDPPYLSPQASTEPPQAITPRSVVAAVIFTAIISVVVSVVVVAAIVGQGPRGDQGPPGIQGPAGKAASSSAPSRSADQIVQAIRDNASEVATALGDAFDPPFSKVVSDDESTRSSVRKIRDDLDTLCQDLLSAPSLTDIELSC